MGPNFSASESPSKLSDTQVVAPPLSEFLIQQVWGGPQDSAFLTRDTNSQGIPMLALDGAPRTTEREDVWGMREGALQGNDGNLGGGAGPGGRW